MIPWLRLNILDVYFVRKWIHFFLICFVALYGLILLGDLVNNLLRNKYGLEDIFILIAVHAPFMWSKVLPVCCCMASLFCLQSFIARSELVVFLGSGFTRWRFTILFILLGSSIGLLQLLNLGFVEPKTQRYGSEKFAGSSGFSSSQRSLGNNRFWIKSLNYIGSFTFYDAKNQTMYQPEFYFFDDQFEMSSFYKAKFAYFAKNQEDVYVWNLSDVDTFYQLNRNDFPSQSQSKSLPIFLKEGPQELTNFQSDVYSLTLFRFHRFISSLKDTGINLTEYYFHFYDKFAHALLCIIFTLFPWMITRQYNNRHAGAGKTILYGLVFSLLVFGIYMAQSKILLGMGTPPFYASLFLPLIWFIYSLRRSVR